MSSRLMGQYTSKLFENGIQQQAETEIKQSPNLMPHMMPLYILGEFNLI